MYPSLAITQNLYPKHLGSEFIDIYDKEIVSVRLKEKKKPKKERDFVIVEGFKLAANGTNLTFFNIFIFAFVNNLYYFYILISINLKII